MKKIIITLVSCLVAIAPVFAQNRIVKSYANLRTQSNVNSTVIESMLLVIILMAGVLLSIMTRWDTFFLQT